MYSVQYILPCQLILPRKFILILCMDLVTEYNHGEMMWQPNTPTTPGKDFLSLDQDQILPTLFNTLAMMFLGKFVF